MRGGWKWVLAWARRETGLPKGRSDGLKGPVLVVNEGKEDQEKREVVGGTGSIRTGWLYGDVLQVLALHVDKTGTPT
jgi:hypothetical protein